MKITIAGIGYVGLSLAVLLAQNNDITISDILPDKVELVNRRRSPVRDAEIEQYMSEKELRLRATTDCQSAYEGAELVIVAVPTNYDSQSNFFDTTAVENVIEQVRSVNPEIGRASCRERV